MLYMAERPDVLQPRMKVLPLSTRRTSRIVSLRKRLVMDWDVERVKSLHSLLHHLQLEERGWVKLGWLWLRWQYVLD